MQHNAFSSLAHNIFLVSLGCVCFLSIPTLFSPASLAQESGVADGETVSTNPKNRTPTVTATVLSTDSGNPSIPILNNPTNNELLATNIFTFIWEPSTDDQGINKYEIFVDGEQLYGELSPYGETTENYILISEDGKLKLKLLTPIQDGLHTWRIKAYDSGNHMTESATWSFTIDTNAPALLVTSIGTLSTQISAYDSISLPREPITFTSNNLVLKGSSENNATLTLQTYLDGTLIETQTTSASTQGLFQFTLPTFVRGSLYTITILSRDTLGNTAIIYDIPILVKKIFITLPPPIAEIIPGIPPIEIIPPEEIKQEIKEEIIEIIQKQTPLTPEESLDVVEKTTKTIVIIENFVGLFFPFLRIFVSLILIGIPLRMITPGILHNILIALGIFPPALHHGYVFDNTTRQGIPSALITIFQQKQIEAELQPPVFQGVTNAEGYLGNISLKPGEYIVEIRQRDYIAKTTQVFVEEKQSSVFVFGLDVVKSNNQISFAKKLFKELEYWAIYFPNGLAFLILIISVITVLISTTPLNILLFIIYGKVWVLRLAQHVKTPSFIAKLIIESHEVTLPLLLSTVTQPHAYSEVNLLSTSQAEIHLSKQYLRDLQTAKEPTLHATIQPLSTSQSTRLYSFSPVPAHGETVTITV